MQKNFPKSEELLKKLTRMWFEDMRNKPKNGYLSTDATQIREGYTENRLTHLRLTGPKGHELGSKIVRLT